MDTRDEEQGPRELRVYQRCQADRKSFAIAIPSSSDSGTVYEIKGSFIRGEISCTCPGFQFRENCKHLRLEVTECGWSALTSPEPQTMEQKKDHICPLCGSATVDAASGDF